MAVSAAREVRSRLAIGAVERLYLPERHQRRWSQSEDTQLALEVASGLTRKHIARLHKRGVTAIRNRSERLGLGRVDWGWTIVQEAVTKVLLSYGYAPGVIAKLVGRSRRAVIGKAYRHRWPILSQTAHAVARRQGV